MMDNHEKFWGVVVLIVLLASIAAGTSCFHKLVDAEEAGGYYERLDPHRLVNPR